MHSVWRPGGEVLTGGVWDAFLALPPLLGRPLERVAILGNAAGTTARALGRLLPRCGDRRRRARPGRQPRRPSLLRARGQSAPDRARRGRAARSCAAPTVATTSSSSTPTTSRTCPFYLATREFFRLVRERLAPGGIVALNVAAVPGRRTARATAIGQDRRRRAAAGARVARTSLQHHRARVLPSRSRRRSSSAGSSPGLPISRRCATCSPATSARSRAPGRPVDGRPCARRVDHGPDDHLVRGRGRAPGRGLPAHAAGRRDLARATRRATARDRPPRGGRARAGEHARGVSGSRRGRCRPRRVRRARARATARS